MLHAVQSSCAEVTRRDGDVPHGSPGRVPELVFGLLQDWSSDRVVHAARQGDGICIWGRRPLLCAARSMPASASTPMPSPAAYPPCGLSSSVTRWWPARVPFHSRTQPSFRTPSIASAMASSSAAVCLTRSSSVGRFAMRYCRVSSGSTKRVHRAKNTDRKTTASVLPVLAIEPCTDAR